MYTTTRAVPVMAGFAADAPVQAVKGPFYMQTDPVAAYLKALQKSFGIPATGVWDEVTHNAVMSWGRNFEVTQQNAGSPAPLTIMPAWGQPFTQEHTGETSIENTALLVGEIFDAYMDAVPSIYPMLGWADKAAQDADPQWEAAHDAIAAQMLTYIAAQEAAAVVSTGTAADDCPTGKFKDPSGACVEIPPVVVVTPVVPKPWYKRTSTWLIIGGVVVVGGVVIAAGRKG